jgi:flagellar protein FlgJ
MNVEALTSMRPLAVAEPSQRSSARPEPGSAEAAAADRKKVSQQFEAILVRQLLGKTMTKMLGSGDSTASSVYGDMMTDSLATQLTAGPGLGIGRMLEKQLAPRGGVPAVLPANSSPL